MYCPKKFNSKTLSSAGVVQPGQCQCERELCAWWESICGTGNSKQGAADAAAHKYIAATQAAIAEANRLLEGYLLRFDTSKVEK